VADGPDAIGRILKENGTVAVVGVSDNPERQSYGVARYLKDAGYRVIPVNPKLPEFYGEKAYPDLRSIPGPVDVVDIFRAPDAVPEIVEQAIEKKVKVVWMQPGAENLQAAERAKAAGIEVVMGQCMKREHMKRNP
jgi:uncharacterized protein